MTINDWTYLITPLKGVEYTFLIYQVNVGGKLFVIILSEKCRNFCIIFHIFNSVHYNSIITVQPNKWTHFFIMKPTRCTNFTNLLRHETLHVSDSSSVHHQEFIHCTLSNGICHTGLWTAFEQDQDGTAVPSWSCSKAVYKPVWHIPVPNIQWINSWWWTEELSETCRVSCQNKLVKLVHLVGFIIKKFVNDARSHERKKFTHFYDLVTLKKNLHFHVLII
jgi:hypothetical protein